MPLLNLYNLREMANTRKAATWAFLDWAAEQEGEFTISQAYEVYIANSPQDDKNRGMSSFQTLFQGFVAGKYDPNSPKLKYRDEKKYGDSDDRPIGIAQKGRQGARGTGYYYWRLKDASGANRALRTPPVDADHGQEDPIGDAMTRIEKKVGKVALHQMLRRWKTIKKTSALIADIQASVPLKLAIDAFKVATEGRPDLGGEDVADAGQELQADVAASGGQQQPRPAAPSYAKAKAPAAAPPAPSNDDDDDMGAGWQTVPNEDDEEEDMGDGWSTVPNDGEEPEAAPEEEEEPEETPQDDEEEGDDSDDQEFPPYLPDPNAQGNKYERFMHELVESGMGPDDPLWEKLKNAKNDIDVHKIVNMSSITDKRLRRAAVMVAQEIFTNTGRDWETGNKVKEGLLNSLFIVR